MPSLAGVKPLASNRMFSDPGVTGGGAWPGSGLAFSWFDGVAVMARETAGSAALAGRTSTRAAAGSAGRTSVTSGCTIATELGEPSFGTPGGMGGTVITLDQVND